MRDGQWERYESDGGYGAIQVIAIDRSDKNYDRFNCLHPPPSCRYSSSSLCNEVAGSAGNLSLTKDVIDGVRAFKVIGDAIIDNFMEKAPVNSQHRECSVLHASDMSATHFWADP